MDGSRFRCGQADFAIVAALFTLAFAGSFAVGGWAVDDSWIVLRYVRNVLAGHGWVYNLGEFVNGSTSTLNTLVLSGLGWLTGSLHTAQHWTLALAIGGTATIFYFEFCWLGRVPAAMAAVIILASPMQFATLGLEPTLVLFFGSATVSAFRRNRLVLAGVAFGCLFLSRGDGILLGAPLAIAIMLRTPGIRATLPQATQLFGTSLVVVMPWLAYSSITFGSPMPQTFGAKLAQTAGGAWGDDTFFAWIPYYFDYLDWRDLGTGPWPFVLVLLAGVALAWRDRGQLPVLPPILAWCALQCLTYSVLRLPRYDWYYSQLLFATSIGAAVSVLWLWGPRGPSERRLTGRQIAAITTCCIWLFVTVVDFAGLPSVHYPAYERTARWLDDNTHDRASIAAMDIGVLGYQVGNRPIVDMCSLVHGGGVEAIAAGRTDWWLDARKPDYVVMHVPARRHFEQPALDRPDFALRYECAADPAPGMRIYRRRAASRASTPR